MAAQGTALTPTLSVITSVLADVRRRPDGPRKDWYLGGATVHGQLAVSAAEAGVSILAGTDSRPCGRITDEILAFTAAGMPPHPAIGAASWDARTYLGLGGLAEGTPADAVIYDADPRQDQPADRTAGRDPARSALLPPLLSQRFRPGRSGLRLELVRNQEAPVTGLS